jgi:two-component system aerobic respiration control sensor histidine kinase ArcB
MKKKKQKVIKIPPEHIIEEFPGHLYWKDMDGHYLGANLEQAKSLGFANASELIGKTDFDFIWHGQARQLRLVDEEIMASGQAYILEEIVDTEFEENQTFISKKSPLRDQNGDIVGVIGTSINITHQKQLEDTLRREKSKAEDSSRAKSEFISNMSHDLRTPLSGIQSLAENILNKTTDSDVKKDAELLIDASEDLLNLFDDILNMVRTTTDSTQETQRDFSLSRLLTSTIEIMKPSISEKNFNFHYDIDDNIPNELRGYDLYLQRIIMNLLSNAFKFTPASEAIALSVELHKISDLGCSLKITVADTGIGIPEDKIDYIFEEFNRLSSSYSNTHKGAGIGLYMVKRYIEKMKGSIQVEPNDPKGTRFIILLPFSFQDKPKPVFQENITDTLSYTIKDYSGVRVLIVEDNLIAQKSQAEKLRKLGCIIEIAGTAKEATEKFQSMRFDLLILDVGLPDISGWRLAKRFRNSVSNPNSLLPIVILTAHAITEDLRRKNNTGLTAILRKPLMQADAENLLSELIL